MRAQERVWRLRMKREWIREQLRALRGFPADADNASHGEPWDEAFGAASVPPHTYLVVASLCRQVVLQDGHARKTASDILRMLG